MVIFLLSGKAESGKDTFYNFSRDILKGTDYILQRLAFGDEVKKCAVNMGWNGEKDENGRSGLIMIGDGAREYFDKDIWIKKVQNALDKLSLVYDTRNLVVFITDCRYENEVVKMRNYADNIGAYAYAVRVNRLNHTSRLTEEQLANASETDLDSFAEWDYIIENETYEGYRDSVEVVINDVFSAEGK